MAMDLEAVVEALGTLNSSVSRLEPIAVAIRDLLRSQAASPGMAGPSQAAPANPAAMGGPAEGGGASASQGGAPGTSRSSQASGAGASRSGRAAQASANAITGGILSASNPLTPNTRAALTAGETLTTGLLAALVGGKAAESVVNLGKAGLNAAGGSRLNFTLDNTLADLQGTLSSFADQGISPSDDQLKELAGGFKARAGQRFDLLKRGAAAVDSAFGGALTARDTAEKELQEKQLKVLEKIELNQRGGSSSGGSASPASGLRE
jgi:hypothetical protein